MLEASRVASEPWKSTAAVVTALLSQTLYALFIKPSTFCDGTGATAQCCHVAGEHLQREVKYPMYYLLAVCSVTEAVGGLQNSSIRHFLWKLLCHKSVQK